MNTSLSTRRWQQGWFLALLLCALTFLTYQPAWNGEAVFDDDDHLTQPELGSLKGLARIWTEVGVVSQYYPITHSVFWLGHLLWGHQMTGYHIVNILLHVLCALLLGKSLRQLEIPGAWLAAAIFALHPVHVESVAWISEIKNTLSTAFYLGAALAYLKFDKSRKSNAYLAALALFIAGLLSKTVVASLPAALLIVFWWKRGTLSWKRDAQPLVPFFILGAGAGLFTAWIERKFIGAEGEAFELAFIERVLIAGRAVWFYLGKLSWPIDLIFIYPRWKINPSDWWQYLFPITALVLVTGLWSLRRRCRGLLAALLFFVGTLFPVMGFLNVYPFRYSFVADHYQYLASMGMITIASAGMALLLARFKLWNRPTGTLLCVTLLGLLATLSWRQSRMYTGVETIWRTTLARNPSCFVAHANLGQYLFSRGQVDEAIVHIRKALELQPKFAEIHNNLGNALLEKDRPDEALAEYQKAIELRPDLAVAHYNVGAILLPRGQVDEAMASFQKAVQFRPDFVKARNNLGSILLDKGQVDEAIVHIQKALEIRPDDADANNNLGNALLQKGRIDEAIAHYQKTLAVQPDSVLAHYNLGCALLAKDRFDDALLHLSKATELQPDFAEAHITLGKILASKGQLPEAVAHYQTALRFRPDDIDTLCNLAWIQATSPHTSVRNGAESVQHARHARELTNNQNPLVLQILAAAYAENNEFSGAIETTRQALLSPIAQSDAALLTALREQQELYQKNTPFRDPGL